MPETYRILIERSLHKFIDAPEGMELDEFRRYGLEVAVKMQDKDFDRLEDTIRIFPSPVKMPEE